MLELVRRQVALASGLVVALVAPVPRRRLRRASVHELVLPQAALTVCREVAFRTGMDLRLGGVPVREGVLGEVALVLGLIVAVVAGVDLTLPAGVSQLVGVKGGLPLGLEEAEVALVRRFGRGVSGGNGLDFAFRQIFTCYRIALASVDHFHVQRIYFMFQLVLVLFELDDTDTRHFFYVFQFFVQVERENVTKKKIK